MYFFDELKNSFNFEHFEKSLKLLFDFVLLIKKSKNRNLLLFNVKFLNF